MEKKNTKLVVLTIILAILVLLLGGYIVYDKLLSNNDNKEKDKVQENINENKEEDNSDIKYDENNFIRQTKITLIEEPNCTGNSSSLVANIEANGNISISQNRGAAMITPGNAKYLFKVGKLACDVVSLYYITNNNELYVLDNPRADMDRTATKVIDNEVIEFLGTEIEETKDGYNHYIKVLLKDNSVKYINYMTTVK